MSNNIGKLEVEDFEFTEEFAEHYRFRLVENYLKQSSKNGLEQFDLDFTKQCMIKALDIINASDEEILNMFFRDSAINYAEVNTNEYFQHIFDAATQLPDL